MTMRNPEGAARRKRRLAGAALAAAVVWWAPAGPAEAQESSASETGKPANPDETKVFSVPAGALAGALDRFSEQSGLSFAYRSEDAAALASPGLNGTFTAREALARLLAGTGLVWRFTGPRTVVLEKVAAGGAMTLDPVTVEGGGGGATRTETAYGPVPGYVARRSATATKTDTPIAEIPQSISVVGAEEMEVRNVQTLEDAIKYTPGVHLSYGAAGDNRSSWYSMRGFAVTTTYYRDGMKISGQNWQRVDPLLLERVEILRGPSSVMYGQNIPGGMVNAVTLRPRDTFSAQAAAELGSFDWKRVEGDVTGPIDGKKRWLFRATAAIHDSDGLNGIAHDDNDRRMIAPALTWKPDDGTAVTLALVHQRDESAGWWPRMSRRTAAGDVSPNTYLGEPDYDRYNQEQTHVTVLAEHAINDTLKFNLAARYSNLGLDYRQVWPGTIQAGGTTMTRSNYAYRQDADVYTLDARVEKKLNLFSTGHTLSGGFDYLYQDRRNWFGSKSNDTTVNMFSPSYGTYASVTATTLSKGDIRSPGLYAQDQISVGDNWIFLMGGRQDLAGSSAGSPYPDTFTGRLGIAYKTGFGLVPYASYGESFEPQSGNGWGGGSFVPTTGRQYEAGLKYDPPGTNISATVALFDLVKENVLTTDPDSTHVCGGSSCSVQTGEVTSRGLELGLTAGLAEGLNIVAAYTYNPVIITGTNTAADLNRRQAATPMHTGALWMDYGFDDGPLAGLRFGGGLRYVGATVNSARDLWTAPQILDEAMIRYDLEEVRFSMNVRNMLDRDIEYSCSRSTNGETCYLNEPLTIVGRVSRKF